MVMTVLEYSPGRGSMDFSFDLCREGAFADLITLVAVWMIQYVEERTKTS